MLKNTFLHLPGIGEKKERALWARGISSWEGFRRSVPPVLPFAGKREHELKARIDQSILHLEQDDPAHFAERLPPRYFWRLFPEFRKGLAYLDIETTGLGSWSDHITSAAVYDGNTVATYVYGDNLDSLPARLASFKVLVTYNGSCFDIPFIERFFGIKLGLVHIDLRYLLRGLGYRGGLKGCEKQLGIDRAGLDGVDGYFAVLLWQEYQRTGNRRALDTLLSYNVADTVNLETLAVLAYNMKLKETPFFEACALPTPCPPANPFAPDPDLIGELRDRFFTPAAEDGFGVRSR
jgi:uncharacterized protein